MADRKQTFAASVVWIGAGVAAGGILESLVRMLGARLLGPEFFGEWSVIATVYLGGAVIAGLGMDSVLARFTPLAAAKPGPGGVTTLLAWSNRRVLLGVILTAAFLGLAALYAGPRSPWPRIVLIAVLLMPAQVFVGQAFSCMRGLHRTRDAVFMREILARAAPVLLLGAGFLAARNAGAEVFFGILVAGVFAGNAAALWAGRQFLVFKAPAADPAEGHPELKKFSLAMFFSTLINQVYARMDMLLAGWLLPMRLVGIYSVARTLPLALNLLPTLFNFSLLPLSAEYSSAENLAEARRKFLQVTRILSVLAFGFAGMLWSGSSFWIGALFGRQYLDGETAMVVLIAANLLMALFGACGAMILGFGKSRAYLISNIAACAAGVAAQILMTRAWGIEGLAAGVLVTVAAAVLIRAAVLVRTIGFPRWAWYDFLPPAAFLAVPLMRVLAPSVAGGFFACACWTAVYAAAAGASLIADPWSRARAREFLVKMTARHGNTP